MARRGPKPKTKTRMQISARLRALAPQAMDTIESAVTDGDVSLDQDRSVQHAWKVIEYVEGKPPQRIRVGGDEDSGPVRVRLEPADYEQGDLP